MGEYIEIPVGDTTAEAYLTGTTGPGVLLYMDAIGLRPRIEEMADRIASWGHVVLAPNVFWREGRVADLAPTLDLRLPENRAAFFATGVMDRVGALTTDRVLADAPAWLEALQARTDGVRATVGYCFGGRLALRTAAAHGVPVVAMFHTGGIVLDGADSPHLLVPGLRSFVLAGHADHDHSNTPEQIAALDAALEAAGVTHRTAVYPDAPHGYTMADTSSYQAEGAERHFRELREALES